MSIIIDYRGVEVDRAERTVLRDVTFQVSEGEFCYLVGRVGSGKSSLMKTMYADVPVASGEKAEVLGFDLTSIRKKQIPYLRRSVGIVFQDFQLLQDRSAMSNLRFVLEATGWKSRVEIDDRIAEVLKAVGMDNKGYKMPHELSGGEQQRTGNLDPQTGYQIVKLLHRLASEGTAVVMATHNLQMTEDFPARVLRCEDKCLTC